MSDVVIDWYISDFEAELDAKAAYAVKATADDAANWMRAFHPWENYTFAEEESIFSDGPYGGGDIVWARAGAWQQPWGFLGSPQLRLPAIYLEFGTHHMDARPFIRPALAATWEGVLERLRF